MTKREEAMAKKTVKKLDAYARVFTGKDGEDVLWDLMSNHFIISSTFDTNPTIMAMREGERNVVLRVLKILNMDVKTIKERIRLNEQVLE